jgi:purine-binding chemotaxis protein CheW
MTSASLSEADRRTLEERALRLAQPIVEQAATATIDVIALPVGDERYGIEMRHVLEVLRGIAITPLPGTPDIVVGIVNRRGEILPVFDLRPLFGRPAVAPEAGAAIVVLGGDRAEFGILAGAETETRAVATADIVVQSPFVGGEGQAFVRGTTAEALIILDGQALMKDRRLFIGVTADSAGETGKGG